MKNLKTPSGIEQVLGSSVLLEAGVGSVTSQSMKYKVLLCSSRFMFFRNDAVLLGQ